MKSVFRNLTQNPYPFIRAANLFVLVETLTSDTTIIARNDPDGLNEVLDHGRYGYLAISEDIQGVCAWMNQAHKSGNAHCTDMRL